METIVLCVMLLVSTGNFLFAMGSGSECVDTGISHSDEPVFVPINCRPTKCAATGLKELTAQDFQCSIGNYFGNHPNACKDIKDAALHHVRHAGSQVLLQDICQAKLETISLYAFHCKELIRTEVALNFTFQLPLCGTYTPGSSASAVMVDFNAKHSTNFFATYPICRVFNFSGSDFSDLKHDDSILVSYECLAIGLQDKTTEVYYYLAFTAYPTDSLLNYTLVFKDVGEDSMRLVAAAWMSTTRVHIVFLPISGVTEYFVTVSCHGHENISRKVSSSLPSAEFMKVPLECNIVTVWVMPLKSQCETDSKKLTCSSIKVILHDKRELPLPVEQKTKGNMKIGPVLLAGFGIVVIIALVIAGLIWYERAHHRNPADYSASPVKAHKVLCIASPSSDAQNLMMGLKAENFDVTDAVQENVQTASELRDYDTILIFMHSSVPDSDDFMTVMKVLNHIFENQGQLLVNVKVVSFCNARPSQVLQGKFDNPQETPFLVDLDHKTYNLPKDKDRLFKDLDSVAKHSPACFQEQREEQARLL